MNQDTSGNGSGSDSLEDLVYRPRLSVDGSRIRGANPLITLPLTVLGYAALAALGWLLVRQSRAIRSEAPRSVILDLSGLSDGDPPAPAPASAQASAPAGPPPGALEKPDVPIPTLPSDPEEAPDKPSDNPSPVDHSQTAFPTAPTPGVEGTGTSGTATGTGSGTGPRTVRRDYESMKIRFTPKEPPYPAFARQAGIQGTVRVDITVGTDGVPIFAKAVEGPPMLRAAAEAQAMKYRYEPAMENGEPVIAFASFTITFRLSSP